MKILFLSQRVPYPPNRGDKISTWRTIERMQRQHEVRIIAFADDAADLKAAEDLRGMGFQVSTFRSRGKLRALPWLLTNKPITLGAYGSKALQAEVDKYIHEVDMAYAFSSSMGAFFLHHQHLPRVMHFAELDSDKWRQYALKKRFPASWIYQREYRTLFAFEKQLAAVTVDNIFCTSLEKRIFEERIPGLPATTMRNGIDLKRHQPDYDSAEAGHMVFVGVMDYYPNVEGCLWFCKQILPEIQAQVPGARFSIVGSHPTPEIQRLGQLEGVEVTGFVDDPRDWLRRGALSVAPLRIARGIQNKVLEAMAMGLPVVGTTSATQGVEGQPGRDFLVEDEVGGQVEAICGLLRDPARARALGQAGREFVEQEYDWEITLRPLDRLLERIEREL